MEKFVLVFFLTLIFLFASCTMAETRLSVFRGNQNFIKGEFQSANIRYLKSLDLSDPKYKEWIRYNLGNVYFALGERTSAEEEWLKAVDSPSDSLKYAALFNLGIFFYEEGKYEDAYRKFKEALLLDSSQVDAKLNLELSLEKMETREPESSMKVESGANQAAPLKDYARRILEYVKRKEEHQWVAPVTPEGQVRQEDW